VRSFVEEAVLPPHATAKAPAPMARAIPMVTVEEKRVCAFMGVPFEGLALLSSAA